MVVRSLRMLPVECVARGYLAGSGLAEYERDRTVCGLALPEGLVDGSRLPAAVFTPATKAEVGEHDENVSFERVAQRLGAETAARLRQVTLALYARARDVAATRGIVLADTKFEFGFDGDDLVLADEVLTPDSSRFWPAERWRPGSPQPSFDKQFVRDWLTSDASGWDRAADSPPPAASGRGRGAHPGQVRRGVRAADRDALALTGARLLPASRARPPGLPRPAARPPAPGLPRPAARPPAPGRLAARPPGLPRPAAWPPGRPASRARPPGRPAARPPAPGRLAARPPGLPRPAAWPPGRPASRPASRRRRQTAGSAAPSAPGGCGSPGAPAADPAVPNRAPRASRPTAVSSTTSARVGMTVTISAVG